MSVTVTVHDSAWLGAVASGVHTRVVVVESSVTVIVTGLVVLLVEC